MPRRGAGTADSWAAAGGNRALALEWGYKCEYWSCPSYAGIQRPCAGQLGGSGWKGQEPGPWAPPPSPWSWGWRDWAGRGDTLCLSHFPREASREALQAGRAWGVRKGGKGQDCDRGRGGGSPWLFG